jgi:hypothetical protein
MCSLLFVEACGYANAKAPGYEANDFLVAAVASEESRGRPVIVASGHRYAFRTTQSLARRGDTLAGSDLGRLSPLPFSAGRKGRP